MICIIDYGVGNLFSLKSSFSAIGVEVVTSGDIEVIKKADKIILPGVGAFEDAANKLFSSGIADVIIDKVKNGTKLLGICLGMQLLFDKSFEYGEHKGLGLIKGEVKPISDVIDKNLKIPHIGWNALKFSKPSGIYKYVSEGDAVYFVHSYYACGCDESVTATAEYSYDLTASVEQNGVYGCQYHPEKSGNVGLKILKAFCEL